MIFLDTSALLAILNGSDVCHAQAKNVWEKFVLSEKLLISNNYVLIETFALVHHRLGINAARTLHEDILPIVRIEWVNEQSHNAAVSAFFAASKKTLSLVDCMSFETMRALGIKEAFTFDKHFRQQGFRCIP